MSCKQLSYRPYVVFGRCARKRRVFPTYPCILQVAPHPQTLASARNVLDTRRRALWCAYRHAAWAGKQLAESYLWQHARYQPCTEGCCLLCNIMWLREHVLSYRARYQQSYNHGQCCASACNQRCHRGRAQSCVVPGSKGL